MLLARAVAATSRRWRRLVLNEAVKEKLQRKWDEARFRPGGTGALERKAHFEDLAMQQPPPTAAEEVAPWAPAPQALLIKALHTVFMPNAPLL